MTRTSCGQCHERWDRSGLIVGSLGSGGGIKNPHPQEGCGLRSHCKSDLTATAATESGETEQGQGTGSRNVGHGEGGAGQVGTTGVEVAGAGVGPSAAFGEGELSDEDRSAFDGGRGVRVEVTTVVGLQEAVTADEGAERVALTFKEAGGELGLTAVVVAFTNGDPGIAGLSQRTGDVSRNCRHQVLLDERGAGGQLQRGEVGVTGDSELLVEWVGVVQEDLVGDFTWGDDFFGEGCASEIGGSHGGRAKNSCKCKSGHSGPLSFFPIVIAGDPAFSSIFIRDDSRHTFITCRTTEPKARKKAEICSMRP